MLECSITVRDEPLAEKVFFAEEKAFKTGRSEYFVKQEGDDCYISISAKDPTALRATITSVTRILNIIKRSRE